MLAKVLKAIECSRLLLLSDGVVLKSHCNILLHCLMPRHVLMAEAVGTGPSCSPFPVLVPSFANTISHLSFLATLPML